MADWFNNVPESQAGDLLMVLEIHLSLDDGWDIPGSLLKTGTILSSQHAVQGCWQHANITEVVIVGNAALHRGVWFPLLEGIKGIFLRDEHDVPTVFMLMDKPSDYYQIMTKSKVMPMIVGDII